LSLPPHPPKNSLTRIMWLATWLTLGREC